MFAEIFQHLEIAEQALLFLPDRDNKVLRCCCSTLYDWCNPQLIQWQIDIALSYLADLCREQAIEEELEHIYCVLFPDPDWSD